jgi:hypothetical protein
LTGADAALVAQKSVGLPVPQIPDEGPFFPVVGTVDPTVQIGNTNTVANVGQTVVTPISITDDTHGATSLTTNVSYDPSRLTLSSNDVSLSPYLTSLGGWSIVSNETVAGTARVTAYSTNPLPSGPAELVDLSFHVATNAPAGTSPLHFVTSILGPSGLVTTPVDGSITVATPPTVKALYVGSTAWTSAFTNALAAQGLGNSFGFAMPAGSGELKDLPWSNLNKISIKFSSNVNVQQSNLSLVGVNVSSYSIKSFSYDSASYTATWILSSPIPADKVLIALADTVTDRTSGARLDGNWTSGSATQAFPSGNGVAGGAFLFQFNVLPADVTRDGTVNNSDTITIRNAGGMSSTSTGYSVFFDIDGNGTINNTDTILVRNAGGMALPTNNPVAPAGLSSDTFVMEYGGLQTSVDPVDLLSGSSSLQINLKTL